MNNVVTTLAHSVLIGSSSFLQATSKPIISQIGLKFSSIRPGAYELPALEHLEKSLDLLFLVLHPMESISLNSFVLLEHLAMLLTSTLAINC